MTRNIQSDIKDISGITPIINTLYNIYYFRSVLMQAMTATNLN